jgi:plasmid stabilization system protein ParE
MIYRVVVLPRAQADIQSNANWWAMHHSADQAARWFKAIHEQIRSLAVLPERHALSSESDVFPCEIRDKLLGLGSRPTYRAVFTIRDDVVYVLTVRRSAQGSLRPDDVDLPG